MCCGGSRPCCCPPRPRGCRRSRPDPCAGGRPRLPAPPPCARRQPRVEARPLRRGFARHSRPAATSIGGVAGTITRGLDSRAARSRSRREQHRDPRRPRRRPDPPRQSVRPREHRTPLRTGRRRIRGHHHGRRVSRHARPRRSPSATTTPPRRRSRSRSTFYGRRFTSLFVNSDGNLTFEEADNASTARGLERLASGAPRIAPFFADLDPSAGGRVFFDSAPDATTVTWCAVPGFDLPQTITVQAVLFANGAIEFRFGPTDPHRRHRRAVARPRPSRSPPSICNRPAAA